MSSASETDYPDLIFGAGYFYSLANDYWNMHIDDFAIWKDHYLTPDEIIYIMNKGNNNLIKVENMMN